MSIKSIIAVIAAAATLQGCIAVAVVGVVGGASVATDNRSLGNQIDDQKIELDAHTKLSASEALSENTNLQVVSVNGSVLVVGQAPNSYLRDQAIKMLNEVRGVNQLHAIPLGVLIISRAAKASDLRALRHESGGNFPHDFFDAAQSVVESAQSNHGNFHSASSSARSYTLRV